MIFKNYTKGTMAPTLILLIISVCLMVLNSLVSWDGRPKQQPLEQQRQENKQEEVKQLTCLPLLRNNAWETVSVENTRECLIDYPASAYIKLLSLTLVGTPLGGMYRGGHDVGSLPQPYDEAFRFIGADWPPFGYTMIGKSRMHNLRCIIEEVNQKGVPGAIIELGVWRGGAVMFASGITKESGISRDLYLFDAFEAIGTYEPGAMEFLATSMEDVQGYFRSFDLDGPNIYFEKGLFKDTLPAWKDKNIQIAVLRVDGNFYDSYQDAMYYLYEKVPVGGFVIFDDILSHPDVMRFWLDFHKEQGLTEVLNPIDVHATWFRKEKKIKIDWQHFRAPQDANA